ncbi:MAG: division/cell wall cluster transcriptional repressor MraZ [Chlamydiota bacterium]|nr:division/cell wall cluster transcriptional repressor MraZ [Chlamydiota bacterium]
MFLGIYEHLLDARDRVSIPAKMREGLYQSNAGHPVITGGFESCLYLFPRERWDSFAEKVESLLTNREDARRLERYLFSNAQECPADRQGRIVIPEVLKKYAQLKSEVVVVGVRHRIEIWDKRIWEAESHEIRITLKDITERNTGFSI